MKARLIVPECSGYFWGYCVDARNEEMMEKRLEALIEAMKDNDVDLIVTSNNYFHFNIAPYVNAKPVINNILIKNYLNRIPLELKKPIVVGFDVFSDSFPPKAQQKIVSNVSENKSEIRGGVINPYRGIDAIVCFVSLDDHKNYKLTTHIWESWIGKEDTGKGKKNKKSGKTGQGKSICDKLGFIEQNNDRVFVFNNIKIGLLSCGDMFGCCHGFSDNLPKVDLYLNLAHVGYNGRCKKAQKAIIKYGFAKKIFVTMQVKNVSNYRKKIPLDCS